MNTAQMAQMVQWRCRGCGAARPVGDPGCPCGTPRPSADQRKLRLLTAALCNEGNGLVQNNVHNVAVHGNVSLGNYFTESVARDDDEPEDRPSKRKYHSPLASFLMFTSGVAMWMAILVIGGAVAFFIAVLVKAFVH